MTIENQKRIANHRKLEDASARLHQEVETKLKHDPEFYGSVSLEVSFQNGAINFSRIATEQTIKTSDSTIMNRK